MNTTQRRAYTRLFKKLSALRATLSNEERRILDGLLVNEEVTAHRMKSGAVSKAMQRSRASQVEALAHQMSKSVVSRAAQKYAKRIAFRIAFDPDTEEYRIQD